MHQITFLVQGSAPEPYSVHFERVDDGNLNAFCECPAGGFNTACKHRLRILAGSIEDIVSDNADEVAIVASWVPGSDIENALNHLARAEHDLAAAKKQVQMTKKMVARAMAK